MQKWVLPATVFISGMLVMILELIGTRMIAPYFGSSLHVWTAMIGTILGCLSIGYFIGGRIADKKASYEQLGFVLLLNAFACLFLVFTARYILIFLANTIAFTSLGALIATFLLFSIPSILFGVVSPYAAKLQLNSLKSSGRTVGNLYALGTIGSITGTFLAGYYLLSVMGSFQLIFLISVALMINAAVLLKKNYRALIGMSIISTFYFGFLSPTKYYQIPYDTHVMAVEHTPYSDYFILQYEDNGDIFRMLMTDFAGVQSKHKMGHRDELAAAYSRFFTLPACYNLNSRVLLIGGGAFTYPNYYSSQFPDGEMDAVEIDPALTSIAREYFELAADTEQVRIINEDGRVYLNRNTKKYDTILVDAYANSIPPFQLTTKEAIEKMYDSLEKNGLLIMNVLSVIDDKKPTLVDVEMKTVQEVFGNITVYQVMKDKDFEETQGFILVAEKGDVRLQNTCLVTNQGLLNNILHYRPKGQTPIFTDSYAPVESVIF
ncbi:fused MFS/spermidine synthase [Candidatus Roizmanbacteria bacterium]|nr:MAG: fused MFS/spermidine synthase [Candidatus Roizmanbacteria bacterium]